MQHALVLAHPNPGSFNAAMAHAYEAAASGLGHKVIFRDLYRINFEPRLGLGEIPGPAGFKPGDDVVAERSLIGDSDVFAFVYPLWLDAPPAILKGYMERVFGMGFAYGSQHGANEPLLKGRRMFAISSSGAPEAWLRSTGAWDASRRLVDQYFCELTGLVEAEHLHFGGITPGITREAVEGCADDVRAAVLRCFGPPN
jgi:NAD(P)H dehydrogenase (quinone)